MRDSLDAPIEYDAKRRGYYYSTQTYRLPATYTDANNLLALGVTKSLLSLYQGTPIHDAAESLLNSITAPLRGKDGAAWYDTRIVVPRLPVVSVNADTWNSIITALRDNKIITFDYRGVRDLEFNARRVRPYQLLFDSGVWYLYGYAEERKAARIFSLSRMENVRLSEETFSLPSNFDYCTHSGDSYFGVFAADKKYRFKVEFFADSSVWIKERLWAADQKIKSCAQGVTIEFTSTQYDKVLEWVLSRGQTAHPLAPDRLVADWDENVAAMRKLRKR
jgi:predicted DNA-binding transcriptional regulator YafY